MTAPTITEPGTGNSPAPGPTTDTALPTLLQSRLARPWRWWRQRLQASDDKVIAELRSALDDLGIDRPISAGVDTALRRYNRHTGFWFLVRGSVGILWVWFWASWILGMATVAVQKLITKGPDKADMVIAKLTGLYGHTEPVVFWLYVTGGVMVLSVVSSVFVMIPAMIGAPKLFTGSPLAHRQMEPKGDRAPVQVYTPIYQIVEVIKRCAEAATATGEQKIYKTGDIPAKASPALRSIRRAYYMRGIVPLHTMRWGYLQKHARKVVARIHELEHGLYSDPDPTLVELADKWLTIAERYAEGRVGALLDDDLSEVEPVRSLIRDRLRDVLAVVLTVGGVFFTASLDLPQAIEGYVISATAVGVLLLVYGSGAIVDLRRR
ncbi:hypothetical protein OG357_05360 [Streptomyces sp. NBC_01255]|uniref:hypothetical protein n=1 Tax=Streptomyces sp. NBC_01255 TaxID=2903798 RepID=UPI002E36331B|nr:hypothetical protein [Streptomyces sp. NBC_01255]